MSSLDFETEKKNFREFYENKRFVLEDSKKALIALLESLTNNIPDIVISKIEGRVKDKEECLAKFTRKYRVDLETRNQSYSIVDHITDLIGLRIVCLYEDEIYKIQDALSSNFEIIAVTNKISEIETTEASFGYKGLHVDIRLKEDRLKFTEYSRYRGFIFEIQLRTVVQDSWSVLDHKIKYKKSIPISLKRRINTLAALFELADREFGAIRDSTEAEIKEAESSLNEINKETEKIGSNSNHEEFVYRTLDAFSFTKIAQHFFNSWNFEDHKVDGFVQEIVGMKSDITRGKFNYYLRETISTIKKYQAYFQENNSNDGFNPYTAIRHCLYLGDNFFFEKILTQDARESFDQWYQNNK